MKQILYRAVMATTLFKTIYTIHTCSFIHSFILSFNYWLFSYPLFGNIFFIFLFIIVIYLFNYLFHRVLLLAVPSLLGSLLAPVVMSPQVERSVPPRTRHHWTGSALESGAAHKSWVWSCSAETHLRSTNPSPNHQ